MQRNKDINCIDGNHFVNELIRHFKVKNDRALSKELGITQPAVHGYRKKKITTKGIAHLIKKSRDHYNKTAIKAVFEFYPISKARSSHDKRWEIIDKTKDKRMQGIKNILENSHGIYLFYNSECEVIYVGKAKGTNAWNEMKNAFNRERASQSIYRVRHPTTGTKVLPSYMKRRQIYKYPCKIHEIASHFSVYSVNPSLINQLEATIIRMIPNDCVNVKIEKI